MISGSRRDSVGGGVVAEIFRGLQTRRKSLGVVGSGTVFPGQRPSIRFRARKIPRECTPRPTFRKILPKKSSFWRKIHISLKLPEFREFFSHFRETWRSGLISGDSRKFRETWQVCTCTCDTFPIALVNCDTFPIVINRRLAARHT